MTQQQQAMVNGDQAKDSKFISHLASYPVVSDGIDNFKSNPYGRKSLEITNDIYNRFGKPVEPYLETPYAYAKPYVTKADELADTGLGHVEQRFPIVKEDTNTIVDNAKSLVWWPFKVADDTKNYVVTTWNDEYSKTANHKSRGPGVSTSIMALLSTELKIASDFFQAVADFLGPKYEESKKKGAEIYDHATETAEHYKQIGQDKVHEYSKLGQDKVNEYQQFGQEKVEQYSRLGQEKADEAKRVGQDKAEEAKSQAQQTKQEAQKKAGQK